MFMVGSVIYDKVSKGNQHTAEQLTEAATEKCSSMHFRNDLCTAKQEAAVTNALSRCEPPVRWRGAGLVEVHPLAEVSSPVMR